MNQSTYDPCLLYRNEPFGLIGLQTDDTLFLGDVNFAREEQINLEKAQFLAKERDTQCRYNDRISFGSHVPFEPDQ